MKSSFPNSIIIRCDKKEHFTKFTEEYPDFKKWLNQRTFTNWISKYCKFKDINFNQGNSNGLQWFSISNGEIDTNENTEDDEFEF